MLISIKRLAEYQWNLFPGYAFLRIANNVIYVPNVREANQATTLRGKDITCIVTGKTCECLIKLFLYSLHVRKT